MGWTDTLNLYMKCGAKHVGPCLAGWCRGRQIQFVTPTKNVF